MALTRKRKKQRSTIDAETDKLIRQSTMSELFQQLINPVLPTTWPKSSKGIAELIVQECQRHLPLAITALHLYQFRPSFMSSETYRNMIQVGNQILAGALYRWIQTAPLDEYTIKKTFVRDNKVINSYRLDQYFMRDYFRCYTDALLSGSGMRSLGLPPTVYYMDYGSVDNFWSYFGDTDVVAKKRKIGGIAVWCIESDHQKTQNGVLY